MNLLTQMGVAAAANIHFEDTVSYEVGMCMGVKYGSMEVQKNIYLQFGIRGLIKQVAFIFQMLY